MQSQLEKNLKHFLKRKISINLSIIVSFFILGNITLANTANDKHNKNIVYEKNEEIKNIDYGNGFVLEINKDNSNKNLNNSGIIKGDFSTSEFEYEGDKYSFDGLSSWGNGFLVDTISKEKSNNTLTLDNSGLISGNFYTNTMKTHHFPSGNGFLLYGFEKYEETGEYEGFFYPINNIIGDITNTGIIQGSYKNNEYKIPAGDNLVYYYAGSGNGNGIMFYFSKIDTPDFQKINNIINNGIISGYNEALPNLGYSGNGIFVSNLKNLENKGEISGNSIIKTFDSNSEIKFGGLMSFTNGNGVVARYFPNLKITNSGKITGKSIAGNFFPDDPNITPWPYYDGNGNGIYFNDNYNSREGTRGSGENTPLTVNNNGLVTGNAKYNALTERDDIISHYYSNGNGIAYEALIPSSTEFNIDHKINLDIDNIGLIKGYFSGERKFNILSDDRNKYLESRLAKADGSGILFISELEESSADINNKGLVSGNSDKRFGNGISLFSAHSRATSGYDLKGDFNIENSGIISGKENAIYLDKAEAHRPDYSRPPYPFPEIPNENIKLNINNYGILAGKNLVFVNNEKDNNKNIINNLENDLEKGLVQYNNKGLGIKLDDNGNVIEVEVGNGGVITEEGELKGYEVINILTTDSTEFNKTLLSNKLSSENKLDKLIINGVNKGLEVNNNLNLSNSILNSYGIALTLNSEKNFSGKNLVINGGGLRGDSEDTTKKYVAIEGKENSSLTLQNGSIVNGDIDFSTSNTGTNSISLEDSTLNGNFYSGSAITELVLDNTTLNGKIDLSNSIENSLTIKKDTILNGDLVGNNDSKSDKLTFDSASNINIYNKISNFDSINFTNNSQVTVYETAEISGSGEIKIDEGNQLNLRVDGSKKDSNGNIIGHALNNFEGIITGTTSLSPGDSVTEEGNTNDSKNIRVFNIITNGLGLEATIDFSGVNFDQNNLWVKTDSILDRAEIDKDNQNIIIKAEKDIFDLEIIPENPGTPNVPDNPDNTIDKNEKLYIKLNEIYKGIHSSGNNNFEALKDILYLNPNIPSEGNYTTVTDEQQLASLLGYLKQVYTDTPYSFSNEATRKSMKLFHDTVRDNDFKAKDNEWLVYGGLIHQNGDQEQTYYGKNYHGFDTGTADTDVNIKLTGAYGQFEYGNSDTLSTGLLIGGTKSDVSVATSKLDGTSAYIGAYAKKDIKDFRLIAGLGYQYSEYDGTRNTINQSYSQDYKDRGVNLYLDGKYSYDLGNNFYLEPKAGLSYTYITQDGITEDQNQTLALDVDSKKFNILEGTVGLDVKKVTPTEKGKHSISAGVTYRSILKGDEADHLTANYGGSDFEILIPHKNKNQVSVGAKYEVELENGMFYNVKGNYFMNVDSKENTNRNADKGEWRVGVGFGYRFNSMKDLNPVVMFRDFSLKADSYFDFDKSELKPEGKAVVKKISTELNKKNTEGTLKIEGHTDSIGTKEYNQKLSERRAESVENEFKKNITNDKIQYNTKGYGEDKPIAENTTKEGRTKNRRVDIKFEGVEKQ